jgi:hypothetical protein
MISQRRSSAIFHRVFQYSGRDIPGPSAGYRASSPTGSLRTPPCAAGSRPFAPGAHNQIRQKSLGMDLPRSYSDRFRSWED